jgi:hypothetical protein
MENNVEQLKGGSEELKNIYIIREFDKSVARYIGAAAICQEALEKRPDDELLLEDLEMAKGNFYRELGLFTQKFPKLPAIIGSQLQAFEGLRQKDWLKKENILELKGIAQEIFNPFRAESSTNN